MERGRSSKLGAVASKAPTVTEASCSPGSGVYGFSLQLIRITQPNSVGNARQLRKQLIQLRMFHALRGIQDAIT
jgi:hypothetical protein